MAQTETISRQLSVGEAAETTGLSVHTLRYYERIGLLDPIQRASSGHRTYTDYDIGWIEFLKCLRATGMPIETMKRYVDAQREGDHTISDRLAILDSHRREVLDRIAELERYLDTINRKVRYYTAEKEKRGQ